MDKLFLEEYSLFRKLKIVVPKQLNQKKSPQLICTVINVAIYRPSI
jgi:hypothetical protein